MQLSREKKEKLKLNLLLGMGIDEEPVRVIHKCRCGEELSSNSTQLQTEGLNFFLKCSKCGERLVEGELKPEKKHDNPMYR